MGALWGYYLVEYFPEYLSVGIMINQPLLLQTIPLGVLYMYGGLIIGLLSGGILKQRVHTKMKLLVRLSSAEDDKKMSTNNFYFF